MEKITIQTKSKYQLVNITPEVEEIVLASKLNSGIVLVFTPHTTAGVICNEDESRLKSDIIKLVSAVEEHSQFFGEFEHDRDEGNAHAHIVSSISGNSRSFVVENSQLQLGTWQSIMFLEMDGPRTRDVWVQILKSHI